MVILSVQSDKHVVKTNGTVIRDNKRHRLNYVHSVHDKLTIIASSILSTLFSCVKRYKTKRIKENEWIVKKLPRQQTLGTKSIPEVDVIEIVTLLKKKMFDGKGIEMIHHLK